MKCPYCGNGDSDKFLYPDNDDGPYVICLACNGEFEEGEIEYYEAQNEEGEPEEDLGPFPETSIRLDDLPKTLRWLRKMREMTLKEVGKKSGLSVSFLSDIERGRVRPSLETLQKLAIAYRTPLSIYLPSDPTVIKDSQEESEEDKLVSLNIITQLLDQEIEWSKENREQAPDNEADWFVKGLEQAKYLILELSKLDSLDDLSSLEPKVNLPKGAPGYMGDYGGIPYGPFDM